MGNTIEGLSEIIEQPVAGEPITKKNTERGKMSIAAKLNGRYDAVRDMAPITYAASSMQGWRATMEDEHVLASSLTIQTKRKDIVLQDHAVFGVFDGHGGDYTSKYLGDNYMRVLLARKEWVKYVALKDVSRSEVTGVELMKSALVGAFLDLDGELQITQEKRIEKYKSEAARMGIDVSKGMKHSYVFPIADGTNGQKLYLDRSGSTANVVLLTPTHMICSNAGDSRSLVCRDGKALPLSFDHKPYNAPENLRVVNAGGYVKAKRIDGDLAVSRGLGDFRYKMNPDLTVETQKVNASPEIIVCPRKYGKDEFMVIGCDGIWDVVENDKCVELVQKILNTGETDMGAICEKMLDACLEKESKDNMTICIVALHQCRCKI